jgi:rhodanese-related sulfurtransferase
MFTEPGTCPAGEYSKRLAAFLAQAGHDAAGLAGGVVAWRDAGLPLESSHAWVRESRAG